MSKFLNIVQRCLEQRGPLMPGMQGKILPRTKVLDASLDHLKVVYQIDTEFDCNPTGNMHGGMIASLIDSTTVINGMIRPAYKAGISTDLSIQYLRAINVFDHDKIICESTINKAGNKIYFTSCKIKSIDESEVFAIGYHTLFMHPKFGGIFMEEDFKDMLED